eukprot:scaffold236120_cov27-Tisochrysis_lutea.AAC.1
MAPIASRSFLAASARASEPCLKASKITARNRLSTNMPPRMAAVKKYNQHHGAAADMSRYIGPVHPSNVTACKIGADADTTESKDMRLPSGLEAKYTQRIPSPHRALP